jgi:hypothetical protein
VHNDTVILFERQARAWVRIRGADARKGFYDSRWSAPKFSRLGAFIQAAARWAVPRISDMVGGSSLTVGASKDIRTKKAAPRIEIYLRYAPESGIPLYYAVFFCFFEFRLQISIELSLFL